MSCCTKVLRKIHAKTIDKDDLGKAKQFRLFSIARPFMRSFHASWFCFFTAFTSWFGIQPLLPTIGKELKLSKTDLANSGIASVAATVAIRIFIGPLCDKFGPRRIMSGLLILGAIPMALAGVIRSGTDLIILRLFIGILGGTFVPCQFWTSAMFSPKIVGTANAVVGGWGNLGGGFTFILMPGLFELMKVIGADEYLAWKTAVVIPSVICIITGVSILFTCDDCPQGHWANRILPDKHEPSNKSSTEYGVSNAGYEHDVSSCSNVSSQEKLPETKDPNSNLSNTQQYKQHSSKDKSQCCTSDTFHVVITMIVLIIQYGMCFGVEISVNTVMNLYLLYRFKTEGCVESSAMSSNITNMTTTLATVDVDPNECSILDQDTASLIASLFGLMNLFARAMGGIYSDILRKHLGIAGRIVAHFSCLIGEGIMLLIFSKMKTISSAIVAMVFFSTFVQMSEGTTYSIVPYVVPLHVGVVAGFVGAGGNAGALVWNTLWRQLVETEPSGFFWLLGIIILSGSVLTCFITVQKKRIWHAFCSCKQNKKKYNL